MAPICFYITESQIKFSSENQNGKKKLCQNDKFITIPLIRIGVCWLFTAEPTFSSSNKGINA